MSDTCEGLLAIDKPAGPTSHDLVAAVRAATRGQRVGHTGTLDPDATGLLLLVLGRATRLARFVCDGPKCYRGELALGITTDTDDLGGAIVQRHDGPIPTTSMVQSAAAARLGSQMQLPPAFSARRVGGTRLYAAARRGVKLEASPAAIVVHRFDVVPTASPDRYAYEMLVSGGTYVRAVVRDLGVALGCGAAVASLRRTAIGPFRVEDAVSLSTDRAAIRESVMRHAIPIDRMPLAVPTIALTTDAAAVRFAAGGSVPFVAALDPSTLAAVRDGQGRLLGVGEWAENAVKPRLVVPPPVC